MSNAARSRVSGSQPEYTKISPTALHTLADRTTVAVLAHRFLEADDGAFLLKQEELGFGHQAVAAVLNAPPIEKAGRIVAGNAGPQQAVFLCVEGDPDVPDARVHAAVCSLTEVANPVLTPLPSSVRDATDVMGTREAWVVGHAQGLKILSRHAGANYPGLFVVTFRLILIS